MRENRLAKRVGRTRGRLAPELLLLSVAYGLGLTAGHFIGRAAGADAEIRTYLAAYAQALESGSTVTAASLLGVAWHTIGCRALFFSAAFYAMQIISFAGYFYWRAFCCPTPSRAFPVRWGSREF